MFEANHNRKLDESLKLASTELAVRKDIYGYDAEAWALYKNGRYQEAALDMDRAMKLGTREALLYYHAGMIAEAMGEYPRAKDMLTRALSINPHFDLLQARVAHMTLDKRQSR
jgi:tetratricopeptide (TPR) repeat protein